MRLTWRTGLFVLAATAGATVAADGPPCDNHSGYCGQTAWYARPSDTGAYLGYYVGGGSPFRGGPPESCEGVWGWDYAGVHFSPRIALWWNHGRRYQGGSGAYRTDGPRFLQEIKEKKEE